MKYKFLFVSGWVSTGCIICDAFINGIWKKWFWQVLIGKKREKDMGCIKCDAFINHFWQLILIQHRHRRWHLLVYETIIVILLKLLILKGSKLFWNISHPQFRRKNYSVAKIENIHSKHNMVIHIFWFHVQYSITL